MKTPMTCQEARDRVHDVLRHRASDDDVNAFDEHLASCPECTALRDEEAALDRALRKLPRRAASTDLRRAVEMAAREPVREMRRPPVRRIRAMLLAAAAVLAIGAALFVILWQRPSSMTGVATLEEPIAREAINDHLRILYAEHPIEIESGGVHQVKPWFEGRVDFAPSRVFSGDDEFPLEGGAVAYFVDRKAAAFFYRHKLHRITLLVFRADGLPWPSSGATGRESARVATARGFHTVVWRDGDLGFALVSDVDPAELEKLATKVAEGS